MSGFEAKDEDYWFACLSLEAGGQVSEAWDPYPPPITNTTHSCTSLHPFPSQGPVVSRHLAFLSQRCWSPGPLQQWQLSLRGLKTGAREVVTKKVPYRTEMSRVDQGLARG